MKMKWIAGAAITGCALAMCVPMHAQGNAMGAGSAAAMQASQDPSKNGMAGSDMAAGMDATFLKKAAAGGMKEIDASKAALDKSSSPEIKSFAQKMIDDHTALGDKVKAQASAMNVMLPMEPMKADRAELEKLKSMSGDDFEKAYVRTMIADHKKTLALFHQEAASGSDPKVKQLAADNAPTVAEHLKMVEGIQKKMMAAK